MINKCSLYKHIRCLTFPNLQKFPITPSCVVEIVNNILYIHVQNISIRSVIFNNLYNVLIIIFDNNSLIYSILFMLTIDKGPSS